MKNIKKSYIFIFILILIFFISFGASYAIFMNASEHHGKLNIVAGTLDYKIVSDDLKNNKITVKANEIKEVTINLSSLNDVDSKYELFYTLDNTNENVRVGYDINTKDSVLGTIDANDTKKITIVIRNESDDDSTVTFDTIGGLKNNELKLTEGNSLNQVVGKYIAYNIGDEIGLIDGSRWHVLEASDETEESVVLLSDYNLNSDGSYNTECGGDVNSTYTCSNMTFDSNNNNRYNESDENNIGYFIKYTYEPLVTKSLSGTTSVTLPTADQIAAVDNVTYVGDHSLASRWLLTTNYWTKTFNSSNSFYVIFVYGQDLRFGNIDAHNTSVIGVGARPTITTSKDNIVY